MRKTTETKFKKMLSVRVDKELYGRLEEELRRQGNPSSRIGYAVTMTSLVNEMLAEQMRRREALRQQGASVV